MKKHILALFFGAIALAVFIGVGAAIILSPAWVARICGGSAIAFACYCIGRALMVGTRWDRP
jgi:hypothetical protein